MKNIFPPHRKLTPSELRTISYLATLLLAAFAILQGVNEPVIWTFLGIAIGALFG